MTSLPPVADAERISALDGLRGWAAVSVIVYHLTWELFGALYPIYRNTWLSIFGNGAFAVAVFFAISGYVLTIARWNRTDNPPLLLTLIRRYLRLEIPIFGAVLITLIAMQLGLTPTAAAGEIAHNRVWLGSFAGFNPNPLEALRFSLAMVFACPRWDTALVDFIYSSAGCSTVDNYVPFLWTMIVELWGSLLVLTLSQRSLPWGISYVVLAAAAVGAYFAFPQAIPFPLGAMVALAQRDGWLFVKAPGRIESVIATVGALAVLVASGFFQARVHWQVPDLIAGFLLFVCVMRSMPLRALLSTAFSQLLGRLSFPLYLMQYPVIITLGATAIVVLDSAGWLSVWSAIAVMIGTGIVIAEAAALYLPVEILTLGLIRRIGRKRAAPTA